MRADEHDSVQPRMRLVLPAGCAARAPGVFRIRRFHDPTRRTRGQRAPSGAELQWARPSLVSPARRDFTKVVSPRTAGHLSMTLRPRLHRAGPAARARPLRAAPLRPHKQAPPALARGPRTRPRTAALLVAELDRRADKHDERALGRQPRPPRRERPLPASVPAGLPCQAQAAGFVLSRHTLPASSPVISLPFPHPIVRLQVLSLLSFPHMTTSKHTTFSIGRPIPLTPSP